MRDLDLLGQRIARSRLRQNGGIPEARKTGWRLNDYIPMILVKKQHNNFNEGYIRIVHARGGRLGLVGGGHIELEGYDARALESKYYNLEFGDIDIGQTSLWD